MHGFTATDLRGALKTKGAAARPQPAKVPHEKALDAAERKSQPHDLYTQRVVQHTALIQLRLIKHEGVDDSQYIHSLHFVDLDNEQFKNITADDVLRLQRISVALKRIVAERAVAERDMRSVLTAEQFDEYIASFDWDMSHAESDERDDMPWQLQHYMQKVREGDRYTRIANMFKGSKKRDARGRTAFGKYEDLAFSCYEEAIMDLCNAIETDPRRSPLPDSELAGEILRWLDRDVNPEPGFEPDNSAAGVPRIRGSRSKYTLIDADPVVGVRLRKHWRQREALSKAALELLYEEPEEDVLTDEQRQKMRDKLSGLLRVANP